MTNWSKQQKALRLPCLSFLKNAVFAANIVYLSRQRYMSTIYHVQECLNNMRTILTVFFIVSIAFFLSSCGQQQAQRPSSAMVGKLQKSYEGRGCISLMSVRRLLSLLFFRVVGTILLPPCPIYV